MGADTGMDGEDYVKVHCCACWRYTDDITDARGRYECLVRSAVDIVVNGGTLSVEKSAAFEAADTLLAAEFTQAKSAGGSLDLPKFRA